MEGPKLIAVLEAVHLFKIIFTCNAALFAYEFFITIGEEIELVWSSSPGPAVLLYYASRYSAMVEICMYLVFYFGNLEIEVCKITSSFAALLGLLGMLFGQSIIVLRTWAIWNGSRCTTIAFALMAVLSAGVYTYLIYEWIATGSFIASSALSPNLRGCIHVSSYGQFYLEWVLFCCVDFAFICLTVLRFKQECATRPQETVLSCVSLLWHGSSELAISLYRDAFAYFTVMFLFALSNVVATFRVPAPYGVLLFATERILYTCFACRVVLNLRAAAPSQRRITLATIDLQALDHGLLLETCSSDNVEPQSVGMP